MSYKQTDTRWIALDLETEQVAKMPSGKIHALFLCGGEGEADSDWYPWGIAAESVIDQLLADPSVTFVIQNAKFDVWVLRHYGIDLRGRYVDTMIAAHCVNPQLGDYSLEAYGRTIDDEKLDYPSALIRAGLWSGGAKDPALYDVPLNDIMVEYGTQDARLTWKWWVNDILPHFNADERLAKSYFDLHLPAVETSISLQGGLYIDRLHTFKTASQLLAAIQDGYIEFAKRYPRVVKLKWDDKQRTYVPKRKRNGELEYGEPNLASPNDMVSLLLTHGWKPEEFKRETGKPITSQAILRQLIAKESTPEPLREVATFVQDLRSLIGIQNQLMQLLELVHADGFIRGNWWQTGTQTYRYSSSSP